MACIKLNLPLVLPFLLMISTLSPIHFMAQGRQLTKLDEATLKRSQEKAVKATRAAIGSKPPRCGARCKSCGQCEAVKVPIVPVKKSLRRAEGSHFYRTPRIAYSRGDEVSNYKPMCWKCKCGDFYFDPW